MCSVETQVGIGMKDLGDGEPLLRDALEKLPRLPAPLAATSDNAQPALTYLDPKAPGAREIPGYSMRSEEHTSELQSLRHIVCRLLPVKTRCTSSSRSSQWTRPRRLRLR